MIQEKIDNIKINFWFLAVVFGLMAIGSLVSIVFFTRTHIIANRQIAEIAESKRPANLDLISIIDSSCDDCYDINSVLNYIKKENVKINSEKTLDKSSDEGKAFIAKYSIQKLPTFALSGEFDRLTNLAEFFSKTGDIDEDTFIFRQTGAPYTLTNTGEVKGRVNLTLLTDITCTECYDVTQHETILKESFGINTVANIVDTKSAAGQAMVRKYGIKLVPTIILSGQMDEYPSLKSVWSQVGIIAKDGAYVFTTGVPLMGAHKNLTTNRVIIPTTTAQQ